MDGERYGQQQQDNIQCLDSCNLAGTPQHGQLAPVYDWHPRGSPTIQMCPPKGVWPFAGAQSSGMILSLRDKKCTISKFGRLCTSNLDLPVPKCFFSLQSRKGPSLCFSASSVQFHQRHFPYFRQLQSSNVLRSTTLRLNLSYVIALCITYRRHIRFQDVLMPCRSNRWHVITIIEVAYQFRAI